MTFYINWNDNNEDVKNDNLPTETLEKESSSDIASVAVNDMLRTGAIDDEATSLEQAALDSKSHFMVPTSVFSSVEIMSSSISRASDRRIISQLLPYVLLLKNAIQKKLRSNDNPKESAQIWRNVITSGDDVDNNKEPLEGEWQNVRSPNRVPELPGATPEQAEDEITTIEFSMNVYLDQSTVTKPVADPNNDFVVQRIARAKRDISESVEEAITPASKFKHSTEDYNPTNDETLRSETQEHNKISKYFSDEAMRNLEIMALNICRSFVNEDGILINEPEEVKKHVIDNLSIWLIQLIIQNSNIYCDAPHTHEDLVMEKCGKFEYRCIPSKNESGKSDKASSNLDSRNKVDANVSVVKA